MTENKKIIWATDGSKESEEALNYARFFAQIFNSEIIGVHVISMHQRLLFDYSRDPESERYSWVQKAEENYSVKLGSIADKLTAQKINFRGRVLIGEPSKKIIELARSEKVNLIVMGKRGHGLLGRVLIGSTTLRVLRESQIPVLAVRKMDKKDSIDIRNILVPLDISEESDSALNYAIDLAERINANVLVTYVITFFPYGVEIPFIILEDLITNSSDELARRVESIKMNRGTKLEIKTQVIQRMNTSVLIADLASEKDTDLIVINSHGRKRVKRFILGSVAEQVIQESNCAVLALKP
ncbi:MAG: universal stress protein [Deltaproteobacteria bacterium]|nr:universal stress protein [Deltaproteobacteria bacterium]